MGGMSRSSDGTRSALSYVVSVSPDPTRLAEIMFLLSLGSQHKLQRKAQIEWHSFSCSIV